MKQIYIAVSEVNPAYIGTINEIMESIDYDQLGMEEFTFFKLGSKVFVKLEYKIDEEVAPR